MKRRDSIIRNYEEFLESRGLEKSTIDGRIRELDKFGLCLKKRKSLLKTDDLKEYHFSEYLKKRVKFKQKQTISSTMSHLRCFGDYLIQEKILICNPMTLLKGQSCHFAKRLYLKLITQRTRWFNFLNPVKCLCLLA